MVNTHERSNNQTTTASENQLKNSNTESSNSNNNNAINNNNHNNTNFAKNAAAQPKLIPIQSVLHTELQQNQDNQQQPLSAVLLPAQQSTTAHLQQFLGNHPTLPSELPQEDEERLEKLFKQLDRDGNGKIDIHDLSEALREFGLSSVYAEKFLEHSDKNESGDVGLAEFVHYVREHEKNLRLQFSHLDKNRDGKVDLEELISAFKDLGIEVDQEEAKNLLSRMDQDGSLNISFNEWRDFLLLAPSTDIHDLIKFWRHSTCDDQSIHKACLKEADVTEDEFFAIRDMKLADAKDNVKCFFKCMMEMQGFWKDGILLKEPFIKENPNTEQIYYDCRDEAGVDDCDTAVKIAYCINQHKFNQHK